MSEAVPGHPSSAALLLPSIYPPASIVAPGYGSGNRWPPSRSHADGSRAAWSNVRQCLVCSDAAAVSSDTEPDSRFSRTTSLSSADPDSPTHAEVSLGRRMAGMSLRRSSSSASLTNPAMIQPAPSWPGGYAAQSIPPSAILACQTGSGKQQGGRICPQPADSSSVAPLKPQHNPPQPPQTPPPPPPIHPSYTLTRASSSGETVLPVIVDHRN